MEKNRLFIEVDEEDHVFVESVCVNGPYSFYTFFKHLLSLYKQSLNRETENFSDCATISNEGHEGNTTENENIPLITDEKKRKAKKFREK